MGKRRTRRPARPRYIDLREQIAIIVEFRNNISLVTQMSALTRDVGFGSSNLGTSKNFHYALAALPLVRTRCGFFVHENFWEPDPKK